MAVPPGEAFDPCPHGGAAAQAATTSLVRTAGLQVIRVVPAAGQHQPARRVNGEITVQCLQGRVAVTALGATHELVAGQSLHLGGGREVRPERRRGLDPARDDPVAPPR